MNKLNLSGQGLAPLMSQGECARGTTVPRRTFEKRARSARSTCKRAQLFIALSALWLASLAAGQTKDSAEVQLKAAIHLELVDGDLKGAIEQYQKIITNASGNRLITAKALLQMGGCYEKLGVADARRAYERVVRDFSDQQEIVAQARVRLAALRSPGVSGNRISMRQVYSGEIINGTVSPDGSWVSLTDSSGGVAVLNLAAGTKRVLTRPADGYADGSVISPDGRQVAYLFVKLPEWEFQVRIVPMDGNAAPRIVHRSPNYLFVRGWTPDGRNLLVTRSLENGTWQIAMLSVQDSSIRQLKSLSWAQIGASISPDGRYIAYDTPAGDGAGTARDIFVLAADGSQETAIVQHPANDYSTVWSPDGSRVLFVSDRTAAPSLWSIAVKDGKAAGEAELVKSDIGTIVPLTMTPTGTLYYSVRGRNRRNVYRAALGNDGKVSGTPQVVTEKYVNSNWGASLSPDGKQLAYYSDRPDTVLVVRDLSSRQERVFPLNLEINSLYFNGPGWLPDGRSVLVPGSENQRQGAFLYRVDLTTGKAEEVGGERKDLITGFKLSPDGKSVFFQAGGNSQQLARFDLDTRQTAILRESVPFFPQDTLFASPAVSPDGKQIAYVSTSSKGQEIFVTNAAGGEPRVLYRYPEGEFNAYNTLAWTPDHRYILFTITGQQSIWRVPVDGGEAERVGLSMNARIKGPQMHPDGRSIFFTVVAADSDQIWALENFLPAMTAAK